MLLNHPLKVERQDSQVAVHQSARGLDHLGYSFGLFGPYLFLLALHLKIRHDDHLALTDSEPILFGLGLD